MKYTLAFFALTFLLSCAREKEQKLESLDKKSAREVTLTTVEKGDSVLHITKQNIWYNGERLAEKADTIITEAKPKTWNAADTNSLRKVPIFVTVQ
ncbi:hypothetical protein [Sphingobacterium psychroaquaticum]|uniref:Uncharacterized protein n=1 Tax=Sphingobacterium psychroaquaticum TaxID=561061 RepID=A0A1X7HVA5_9SPHI|nr:hypothetical protein [Sphingobacterium psychroaquaticum]QBQ42103.1 hypothetical protein E2P86_13455 [Sphingobacterium psychroaquaticum]SMG05940.1 hypothetical protein SAMN05660862_0096 [Sphingobacterium psychroaquaticum]